MPTLSTFSRWCPLFCVANDDPARVCVRALGEHQARTSTNRARWSGSRRSTTVFAHYTVVLLGCTDAGENLFVVDERAERLCLPALQHDTNRPEDVRKVDGE